MPWPTRNKRQSPEAAFQATVIQYLNLRKVSFRAGMEGGQTKLSKVQQGQRKRLGVSRGWPDIMIHEPRGIWTGLAIELKAPGKYPSPEQRDKLAELRACGWLCVVQWPKDDWQGVIDFYLCGALVGKAMRLQEAI